MKWDIGVYNNGWSELKHTNQTSMYFAQQGVKLQILFTYNKRYGEMDEKWDKNNNKRNKQTHEMRNFIFIYICYPHGKMSNEF